MCENDLTIIKKDGPFRKENIKKHCIFYELNGH